MESESSLSNISCTACGGCCPDVCTHKKGNLCDVHPSIVGEERARELRGRCDISPLELFSWGYYCPSVVEAIERELGIRIIPMRWGAGVLTYMEKDKILGMTRELRGLPPLHQVVESGKNRLVLTLEKIKSSLFQKRKN